MADEADVIKLEVLVYPDGGTRVSVPAVDEVRRVPVLESAADALCQAADRARRDLEPVTCSQCGVVVQGAKARAAGPAQLLPCGHASS